MKPEKVDFYLNKRKEREAESQKPSEDGAEAAEAEQAPNRSDNIQKDVSLPECSSDGTLKPYHFQTFLSNNL